MLFRATLVLITALCGTLRPAPWAVAQVAQPALPPMQGVATTPMAPTTPVMPAFVPTTPVTPATTAVTPASAQLPPAPAAAPAVAAEPESSGFAWPKLTMPKITMPKVTMPKISMPKLSMPKWPTNAEGQPLSPWAPVSSGVNKISSGTKKAWEGTKELFNFGSSKETQLEPQPDTANQASFWQRITNDEPEPTGPRTVAEWMAQPRVGE